MHVGILPMNHLKDTNNIICMDENNKMHLAGQILVYMSHLFVFTSI